MIRSVFCIAMLSIFAAALIFPGEAMAEDGKLSSGDTAWILTSTALVLFMTLPGLALFYGGLVRARNLLSVLMQSPLKMLDINLHFIHLGQSFNLTHLNTVVHLREKP